MWRAVVTPVRREVTISFAGKLGKLEEIILNMFSLQAHRDPEKSEGAPEIRTLTDLLCREDNQE